LLNQQPAENNNKIEIVVKGGVVEVQKNKVIVLAE
jgi:F0F1-type ATP synthase epsilon subunit